MPIPRRVGSKAEIGEQHDQPERYLRNYFEKESPHVSKGGRMYAIVLDLDTDILKQRHHNASYNNAYADIRKFLEQRDFQWQQGTVYFGDPDKVNAVSTILAIQQPSKNFRWFKNAIKDIRMLRIEDNNDLSSVL